jgi:NADPH-dependent ferric siderophore reductase
MTVTALPMRVWTGIVVRNQELTPSMRRIVLAVDGYATTGVGDEYLRPSSRSPARPSRSCPR